MAAVLGRAGAARQSWEAPPRAAGWHLDFARLSLGDRAAISRSYAPQLVLRPRLADEADAVAEVLVGDGIVTNAKGRGRFRSAAARRRPVLRPFTFFTGRVHPRT
jgi:hypothetical protein